MNQQLSSLRSQLLAVQHQLPQLLEECLGRGPLLPGSLYTLRRKCGKPNCHCNRGGSMRAPSCPIAARDGRGTSHPHPSNSNPYDR